MSAPTCGPASKRAGAASWCASRTLRSSPASPLRVHCRYQDLTIGDLAGFDAILWFAGHSSVPMALKDPDGAIANNCLDLLQLAKRKSPRTRLIYASTASVYSVEQVPGMSAPPAMDEAETLLNPVNPVRLLENLLRFAGALLRHCGYRTAAGHGLRI